MLFIIAIAVLVFVVGALSFLIWVDFRKRDDGDWLASIRAWQQILGNTVGFVGGAAVLLLGSAITQRVDDNKSLRSENAIGTALAYEAERMITGLELARRLGQEYATDGVDALTHCIELSTALKQSLLRETLVYDASLDRLVDFGGDNLSLFVRFYAFYADFMQAVDYLDVNTCAAAPQDTVDYMLNQARIGLGYYGFITASFDIASFPVDLPTPAPEPPPATLATLPGWLTRSAADK